MPAFILHYFNIRARAEPVRLAFAAADVKFEDKRYTSEEWQAFKPSKCFAFISIYFHSLTV